MNTETKDFTPEESLLIISNMIRQAQGKVQRNAFYFLLWGWVTALANLGMFLLDRIGYEHPYIVWLITIPTWIYTFVRSYRHRQKSQRSTHFDTISTALWIMFGLVTFTLIAFGNKINYQINPLILLVGSLPTLVSGIILRFRPLVLGGMVFWAGGIIGFLVAPGLQPVVGAAAIIFGYLVPGYLLAKSKD